MKLSILVIGRHSQIMETVLRLLDSQPGWNSVGALTDDEALEKFQTQPFDLVLFGGGVSEESEKRLSENFRELKSTIKIIRHYGGGSGLLFNEIQEAIHSNR